MAQPAYLTVETMSGSAISKEALTDKSLGVLSQESHKDEILVVAVRSDVSKPTDPQSGQVVGVRQHRPTQFTKYIDKSSPLLWQALCDGTQLKMSLKYYRTASNGKQEHYFTMAWEECVLVQGNAYIPNTLFEDNKGTGQMEDWSFTYKKVKWVHEVGGTEGSDDWNKG